MKRPACEVADVFRRYGRDFLAERELALTTIQRRVMTAILLCRTATLGGQVEQCDRCGHRRFFYRSCRNRHCPKCQWAARAAWLSDRVAELLPCQYFHIVFTLPAPLRALVLQNRKLLLAMLFRAASATLREIAADPKHLGAAIGLLAVLHTWGQQLQFHPHLHCVVPGGGLSPDRQRWIACRPGFFLPVRVLSRRFRSLYLGQLEAAFLRGELTLQGPLAALAEPPAFQRWLRALRQREWVVYAKPPFDGPARVLAYLARYTHRVAIANHRLVSIEQGRVRFHWRDYRHHNKRKCASLAAAEFMRRFLMHVLPRGFRRIRYYGFLAAPCRERLALCRRLLAVPEPIQAPKPTALALYEKLTGRSLRDCPACGRGAMLVIDAWPTDVSLRAPPDTS